MTTCIFCGSSNFKEIEYEQYCGTCGSQKINLVDEYSVIHTKVDSEDCDKERKNKILLFLQEHIKYMISSLIKIGYPDKILVTAKLIWFNYIKEEYKTSKIQINNKKKKYVKRTKKIDVSQDISFMFDKQNFESIAISIVHLALLNCKQNVGFCDLIKLGKLGVFPPNICSFLLDNGCSLSDLQSDIKLSRNEARISTLIGLVLPEFDIVQHCLNFIQLLKLPSSLSSFLEKIWKLCLRHNKSINWPAKFSICADVYALGLLIFTLKLIFGFYWIQNAFDANDSSYEVWIKWKCYIAWKISSITTHSPEELFTINDRSQDIGKQIKRPRNFDSYFVSSCFCPFLTSSTSEKFSNGNSFPAMFELASTNLQNHIESFKRQILIEYSNPDDSFIKKDRLNAFKEVENFLKSIEENYIEESNLQNYSSIFFSLNKEHYDPMESFGISVENFVIESNFNQKTWCFNEIFHNYSIHSAKSNSTQTTHHKKCLNKWINCNIDFSSDFQFVVRICSLLFHCSFHQIVHAVAFIEQSFFSIFNL